jgi:hypothetical protein
MAEFGINGVEPSGSATRVLIWLDKLNRNIFLEIYPHLISLCTSNSRTNSHYDSQQRLICYLDSVL